MPAASESVNVFVPLPSTTVSSVPSLPDAVPVSRARIDRNNAYYFVDFPTSISENGDQIAAMISISSEGEDFYPEWLVIKDLEKDRVQQTIDLLDPDLASKLSDECHDNLAACIPDVELQVQAANVVLAAGQWRPFPCISVRGSHRDERMGPGCELLAEFDFKFQDPQLIISRAGRPIAALAMPTWSPKYRKPACKGISIDPFVESVAFDPETGLFVISLGFYGPEGNAECPTPRWDFHPIRLPKFRRKAPQPRDGGAP